MRLTDEQIAQITEKYGACNHGALQEAARMVAEHFARHIKQERTRVDGLVGELSHIHGMLKPEGIKLPDGRVFEFHPPDELVREAWGALSKAIREIPEAIARVGATAPHLPENCPHPGLHCPVCEPGATSR